MSTQKWPKWAKMPSIGKRGQIGKKMMKNNEVVPDFLLKINAPILHPPHYAGKKRKKCPGEAHESAQTWEKPFFHIRPHSGVR